jgi:dihydrofolate reductase
VRKLIESTHVTLGGEIGAPQDWAFPYLDEEHARYATELLNGADASWNATIIGGDVAEFVADLKRQPGATIVKYGNGPLDRVLMAHDLVDEFHLLLTPVAVGDGERHLFQEINGSPALSLADVKRFASGVLILVYTPKA